LFGYFFPDFRNGVIVVSVISERQLLDGVLLANAVPGV
jgi:hypothetical protein